MRRALVVASLALVAAAAGPPAEPAALDAAEVARIKRRGVIGDERGYRAGDVIFTQNYRLRNATARQYPASIAAEYVRRTALRRDFATLDAILRERCPALLRGAAPAPAAGEIVVHVRLGDVMCGRAEYDYAKRPFRPENVAAAVDRARDDGARAAGAARARPVLVVGSLNHTEINSNCVAESLEYVAALAAALGPRGATLALAGEPDADLCRMTGAAALVPAFGHFSELAVEVRKLRGLGVFAPHKGARTYDFDPENRWERPRPGGRARARRR